MCGCECMQFLHHSVITHMMGENRHAGWLLCLVMHCVHVYDMIWILLLYVFFQYFYHLLHLPYLSVLNWSGQAIVVPNSFFPSHLLKLPVIIMLKADLLVLILVALWLTTVVSAFQIRKRQLSIMHRQSLIPGRLHADSQVFAKKKGSLYEEGEWKLLLCLSIKM